MPVRRSSRAALKLSHPMSLLKPLSNRRQTTAHTSYQPARRTPPNQATPGYDPHADVPLFHVSSRSIRSSETYVPRDTVMLGLRARATSSPASDSGAPSVTISTATQRHRTGSPPTLNQTSISREGQRMLSPLRLPISPPGPSFLRRTITRRRLLGRRQRHPTSVFRGRIRLHDLPCAFRIKTPQSAPSLSSAARSK